MTEGCKSLTEASACRKALAALTAIVCKHTGSRFARLPLSPQSCAQAQCSWMTYISPTSPEVDLYEGAVQLRCTKYVYIQSFGHLAAKLLRWFGEAPFRMSNTRRTGRSSMTIHRLSRRYRYSSTATFSLHLRDSFKIFYIYIMSICGHKGRRL